MVATRLRRRLAEAYGIGQPAFVPDPVANYWVLRLAPGADFVALHHYFGATDLGVQLTVGDVFAAHTGASLKIGAGDYDPLSRCMWFPGFEDAGDGDWVYRVDLATQFVDAWQSEGLLGAGMDHRASYAKLYGGFLGSGGAVTWLTVSKPWFGDVQQQEWTYRRWEVGINSGMAGAVETESVVIEAAEIPGGIDRSSVRFNEMWITDAGVTAVVLETFRLGSTIVGQRTRLLHFGGGGDLGIIPNQAGDVASADSFASRTMPDGDESLLVTDELPAPGLALRAAGSLLDTVTWPAASYPVYGKALHIAPNLQEVVLTRADGSGWARGPLHPPYSAAPTEAVTIPGFSVLAAGAL